MRDDWVDLLCAMVLLAVGLATAFVFICLGIAMLRG